MVGTLTQLAGLAAVIIGSTLVSLPAGIVGCGVVLVYMGLAIDRGGR